MQVLRNEKGQSLVEFALVLPIILLILMGILEFGMMLNAYLTINNSSREAARLGSVGGSDTEIQNLIINVSPNLNIEDINVIITPIEGNRKRGDAITVRITYDYQVIIPIIGDIINNLVELESQTIMRIE